MIVVEGPDNSGKTTLIQQLQKDLSVVFGIDFPIKHAGGPGFSSTKLMNDVANLGSPNLLDRVSFISEPIYAAALDRPTSADYYSCVALTNAMLVHGTMFIIHCTGEINRLMDFGNHEVKAHETQEHVDAVIANQRRIIMHYDHYTAYFRHYKNYISYDYTINSYAELLKLCINYLTTRDLVARFDDANQQ